MNTLAVLLISGGVALGLWGSFMVATVRRRARREKLQRELRRVAQTWRGK